MKIMKKGLATLLALLMLISMLSGFSALAGSTDGEGTNVDITTTFTAPNVLPGEIIYATIRMDNFTNVTTGIMVFGIKVSFDPDKYTLGTVSRVLPSQIDFGSEESPNDAYTVTKVQASGYLTITFADTFDSPNVGLPEGDLVKIKFTAIAGTSGYTTFTTASTIAGTPGYPVDFAVPDAPPADQTPNNKIMPTYLPTVGVQSIYIGTPEPTTVDTTLTYVDGTFTVVPTGGETNYTYQVWTEETTVDGTSWKLVQAFDALTGNASWALGDALLTDNYKICVRIKDETGTLVQTINKQFSAKEVGAFKVDSLEVDGVASADIITKQANTNVVLTASATAATEDISDIVYAFVVNGAVIQQSTSNTCTWEIGNVKPGVNLVKVVAWQTDAIAIRDSVSAKVIVVNSAVDVPEISGYTIPATGTAGISNSFSMNATIAGNYRFSISEPGRTSFLSSTNSSFETAIAYPGVYQVFASVKDTECISISDGVVKTITVARAAGDAVELPSVTFESSADGIVYAPLADLDSASKTEYIKITAGLDAGIEYSFWKLDARGLRLVQDYSIDNDLVWRPMQAGYYNIVVRVRAIDFAGTDASYEDSAKYAFNIGGADQAVSDVVITAAPTAAPRTAVSVSASATATNELNVMYRFEISDADMGSVLVQDYSMSNSTTIIPRKAGTYTIRVLAKDANNFGYYDAIATQTLVVS